MVRMELSYHVQAQPSQGREPDDLFWYTPDGLSDL